MAGGLKLTEERIADVLRDLISRFAGLGEVQQLATQHPLELHAQYTTMQCILGYVFNLTHSLIN